MPRLPEYPLFESLPENFHLPVFLDFVHEILSWLVKEGRHLERGLLNDIREAWDDLEKASHFRRLKSAFRNALKKSKRKIRDHGLSGSQLRLKLRVVRHVWNKYLERPLARRLVRVLEAIDVILNSLVDVVGFGKAIQEFKDIVATAVSG